MTPDPEVVARDVWAALPPHHATHRQVLDVVRATLTHPDVRPAAPAVDEATVARVLEWAAETADTIGDGHLTTHALRILAVNPDDVVQALAARDEPAEPAT